jgi:hypothetical protein
MFYHLAEGSELVPLAWVKAVRNPHDRRRFFLENPERFGLIADPSNVDGLPVGVTADTTVDLRFLGVIMMGFNCSACHTNEITYRGSRLRIDGGPSRFNAELLGSELSLAFKETLEPLHLIQFLWDHPLLTRLIPAPNVIVLGNFQPPLSALLGGLAWGLIPKSRGRKLLYVVPLLAISWWRGYGRIYAVRPVPISAKNWYLTAAISASTS